MEIKGNALPSLLIANANKFGNSKVALREKEFGIWQKVTWQEYLQHVKYFSLGLIHLGFERGDKLAIIGDNRPEWVYAELAVQCAGGIPLGIYQDSILTEVAYVINHSDAKFVVAEDQEQTDKILHMKDQLPNLRKIIYTDPKGMRSYDDPLLIYFPEVEELGKEIEKKHPDLFERNVNQVTENDVALIAYTSGTTGFPKGSLLTHRGVLKMAENLNKVDPKYETDEFVSFLPLPWVGEQYMSVFGALLTGYTISFPEEPETGTADLYEIAPHVMFAPPRIWEGISRSVMVKHLDASFFKRFIYNACLPIGYRWADFKFERKKPPWHWKLLYFMAYLCLFRALRDRLGFPHIRSAMTGGAALGPDVFRFFHALGVNLKQIYGITELSGVATMHPSGEISVDTVGRPIPETDIRISPDGEIQVKTPGVFLGYHKNPEATAKAVHEGWLYTGDAGYFTEDQHLVVIDRVSDLMTMNDGTKFSPMFIENKLKFCPYIVEAVVVGHERPYIGAIICIDFKHVGKWAEAHRIGYTTYTDLASKSEIYDLIEKEVYRVNRSLPKAARIKKFVLLYKELDADDEELTRTRKVRRGFISEKYKREIEALYGEAENIPIESIIRYQDGRTATIRTRLIVRTMKSVEEYEAMMKKRWWKFWD
ncbi:MAG: AMP-binding protein [Thermodesulfobacteriota bacterium]|nr:AMP-binding protein [Thermodesulfobacteriota bacterium]